MVYSTANEVRRSNRVLMTSYLMENGYKDIFWLARFWEISTNTVKTYMKEAQHIKLNDKGKAEIGQIIYKRGCTLPEAVLIYLFPELYPEPHKNKSSKKKLVIIKKPSIVKDRSLSALLSFLLPGVGQIYNGQVGKGILMVFTALIFIYAFKITAILYLILWVYGIVNAYNTSNRINNRQDT